MLTPAFDLSQDPDFLTVAIRVPHARVSEFDVYFQGVDFKFYAKPYFLRADFFEDEAVEQVLQYNPWWTDTYSKMMAFMGKSQEKENHAALVSFSEEEKCQLRKFVHKSYLLDKRAQRQVYYSLIDILLAYCYETRVNEGEKNVESAWNIRKLSPTLCWFETWTNVHEVLVSFGRRVLCYPLYRHFKLVTKACRDTIKILQLGKSAVLKCLLDIHKIFQESDQAYILNDLYISDYCVWIQKAKSTRLAALAEALKEAPLTKAQLGLEVNELEAAALLVCEEEAARPASRPTPPSSSEASGSEDSDSSTSSAGTADPDSEPEGLAGRGARRGRSLQGPVLDESRALLVDGHGLCGRLAVPRADACRGELLASARASGGARPLIEELGEQLETAVQLSAPEGPAPGPRRAQADGALPGTGGEGSICG
uniref:Protein SHQ1 homolog n=1 Tax=Myotis myotis TaxID=51298 RepID=A0A7J7UEF0_MYOMY|nr:SHQ1, H/ACA ribonucleoprotein assembly factor [Myotis myotis]